MCSLRLLVAALSLQTVAGFRSVSQACAAEDLAARAVVQNQLAGICESMCKDVGSYPKCECPNYTDTTDKTPGHMTWDELLKYMSDLVSWGKETHKTNTNVSFTAQSSDPESCTGEQGLLECRHEGARGSPKQTS